MKLNIIWIDRLLSDIHTQVSDKLFLSLHLSKFPSDVKKLKLKKLKSIKSHGGVDRALLSFDLDVDLNPAFHWNIKQLFVYVVASYESKTNKNNQIVLWDKIVEATDPPESKIIKQDNIFVKYALVDQGADLRGREVKLQIMWDHMPITGLLYMGEQDPSTMTSFTLPYEYRSSS
jgi:signal peptidase complex subunit 3